MRQSAPTPRSRVARIPERGRYDSPTLHAILDEGLVCHVGFVSGGEPFVIPTTYGRRQDTLYLHGSPASRMLCTLEKEVPVCVTVTHLDGLVLARSAFHHSMNYRSAMIFGRARLVDDLDEKRLAFDAIVEHVVPGRTGDARGPNDWELRFTKLLALPIDEASAKVRSGPPHDDPEDLALPVWAGEIPLALMPGPPLAAPDLASGHPAPAYATRYRRPRPG